MTATTTRRRRHVDTHRPAPVLPRLTAAVEAERREVEAEFWAYVLDRHALDLPSSNDDTPNV